MSFSFARWLKSIKTNLSPRRNQPRASRPTRSTRLAVESLEDRAVPATHTWVGPAGGNWSVAANWNGGVPTSGEANGTIVVFSSNTSSVQNINGLEVDQISFTGGGNSISLNTQLSLRGGTLATQILSPTGNNQITQSSLNLIGTGDPVLQVSAGSTFTIQSQIPGDQGIGFRKTGAGMLTLTSANPASYTGTTAIAEGTLLLNTNSNNTALSDSIEIGDGTGAAGSAILRLVTQNQIPDDATITIATDGLLDVDTNDNNNGQELIDTLNVAGGQVVIDAGANLRLGPNGTVSNSGTPGGVISGPGNLRLEGNQTTFTFNITDTPARADLIITAPIDRQNNTETLLKTGNGNLSLRAATGTGPNMVQQGALELGDAGTVGAVTVAAGGILAGNGNVGAITATGAIAPGLGDQTYILTSNGNANLTGSTFRPVINGTASDTLRVTGTVNLTNATLNPIVLSAAAPAGTVYTLIGISGTTPIPVGQRFTGLAQGATISGGGGTFAISYTGGDGNEVILTLVTPANPPAPPTPPPFYSGATLVGNTLTLTGAGVAGGSQSLALPPGSIAIFADLTGDGRGDVILFLPTLVVVVDGQTGRFVALSADTNGDGVRDLQIFNLNGTTTTTDGRTGRVMTI